MDNIALKQDMSVEELAIVNAELERKKKNKVIMYALWFLPVISGNIVTI